MQSHHVTHGILWHSIDQWNGTLWQAFVPASSPLPLPSHPSFLCDAAHREYSVIIIYSNGRSVNYVYSSCICHRLQYLVAGGCWPMNPINPTAAVELKYMQQLADVSL
jgi:hypothetical protein